MTTAYITTAIKLTEAQQKDVVTKLQKKFGKDIEPSFYVDVNTIGGISIRVGSQNFDRTSAGKLAQLKQQLLAL